MSSDDFESYADDNPYAAPAEAGQYVDERREQYPLARRSARLVARFVDGLVAVVFVGPGLGAGIALGEEDIVGPILVVAGALALMVLQAYLLTRDGQTVGKKALNVRIVMHTDGSNPGFGRAVGLRAIVSGILGAVPVVGGCYSLVDVLFIFREERRCIHDLIAGTSVVDVSESGWFSVW